MTGLTTREVHFASGSESCAATLLADPDNPAPAIIVMAHGFGATRHYGLAPFAQRFAALGLDVLLFDYRHFGESEGRARGRIRVGRQVADWHAAIAHARAQGYAQVAIWGTSFAGGHVLRAAAEDPALAGVISQVPHISGPATMMAQPFALKARYAAAIAADAVLRLAGRSFMITTFGQPGTLAAMNTPGAADAMIAMLPKAPDGSPDPSWQAYFAARNRIAALGLLATAFYSPGRRAHRINAPVLLQAATHDRTTPFAPARDTALRIAVCEFRAHACDHFDVYLGPCFEAVVAEQCDFLSRRIAGLAPRAPA